MNDGEWFYNRWTKAVDSDQIFIPSPINPYNEEWNTEVDIDQVVNDPTKNSFIRVQYHWSEDPTKSDEWYAKQCQELDDQRLINQELDLKFVGTKQCLFDDETLAKLTSSPPEETLYTPHNAKLVLYTKEIDKTDYYLIGCDTAESLNGAFCAIQIFGYRTFNQIGELQCKFGSFTAFGEVIDYVFQWLYSKVGDRIMLCIENNTIGKAPIEHLRFHVPTFNYERFIYREDTSKDDYGIKTTGMSKALMIGNLQSLLSEYISGIHSKQLIDQFSSMERTSSGTVKSTGYSDLFMATCFCAFAHRKKSLEIMPLIEFSPQELEQKASNLFKMISSMSNPKSFLKEPDPNNIGLASKDNALTSFYSENEQSDQFGGFFPIFRS